MVSHGNLNVLIDAGISLRRVRDGLRGFALTPDDLCGVLITHDHIDHISGVSMLLKYHKTPVFCSYGAACGIVKSCPEAEPFLNIFDVGAGFDLGGIAVKSFITPHDAADSVGFTLTAGSTKLAYVTDIGCVTDEITKAALGCGIAVIEANHDKDMLKRGTYPPFLKRRILSSRGHLANCDSADLAVRLAESGLRYLQLAHLSLENNTPELAYCTVEAALERAGFRIGKDVELDVAPHDTIGRVYDL